MASEYSEGKTARSGALARARQASSCRYSSASDSGGLDEQKCAGLGDVDEVVPDSNAGNDPEGGSSLVLDDDFYIRRLGYYKRIHVQRDNCYVKVEGVGDGVLLNSQSVSEEKLTVRLTVKTAQGKKKFVLRCQRRDYFDNLLTPSTESSSSMDT
jgi:hypothetical protein